MGAKRDEWMSIEDFLALDRESLDQKYEYRDGHMYALAGGSGNHPLIVNYYENTGKRMNNEINQTQIEHNLPHLQQQNKRIRQFIARV